MNFQNILPAWKDPQDFSPSNFSHSFALCEILKERSQAPLQSGGFQGCSSCWSLAGLSGAGMMCLMPAWGQEWPLPHLHVWEVGWVWSREVPGRGRAKAKGWRKPPNHWDYLRNCCSGATKQGSADAPGARPIPRGRMTNGTQMPVWKHPEQCAGGEHKAHQL